MHRWKNGGIRYLTSRVELDFLVFLAYVNIYLSCRAITFLITQLIILIAR